MFKIIGAIIISVAFSLLGYLKCRKITKRHSILLHFNEALSVLRSEIALKKLPLNKAFFKAGSICDNSCFTYCAEKIPSIGSESAFKQAVLKYSEEYCFTKNDTDIILSLAPGLGKCDITNQLRQIDYTLSLLQGAIISAEEEKKEKSKMIMHSSVFAGVAVALILI